MDLRHLIFGEILGLMQPSSSLWLPALGKRENLRSCFHIPADHLFSIGMEILKLPAGRLATVFYKNEPQEHQNDDVAKVEMPSKMEKGSSDETLQTIAPERSRRSTRNLQEQLDRKGHTFAWKNISLDIKTSDGKKRLLDGIDGRLAMQK